MNILITGGGTGGHLAIVKALAIGFNAKGYRCFYVGSMSTQDKEWFGEDSKFESSKDLFEARYFLKTTGVVNKKGLIFFISLYKQFLATLQARRILKTHKIQAVFSVGGFGGGPASFGAITLRIPLFIHEQNSVKGSLNKLLSPFAKSVFGSFNHQGKKYFKTSYPVRSEFFELGRVREDINCVIFLGGSQGAKAVNDFAILVSKELLSRGIKVIHQCGEGDFERVKQLYEVIKILERIDLFAFSEKLVEKISQADVCVGRAGASSVWEFCANGLPAMFIPYPYATSDHQYHNALEFDGLGQVVRQSELNPKVLFDFIDKLNESDENGEKKVFAISSILRKKIHSDGVGEIIKEIEKSTQNTKKTIDGKD